MHVVQRMWPDAKIVDVLTQNRDEVEKLLKQIPGFKRWVLMKFTDGTGGTATICEDKAGCDRSMELSRGWVAKNAPEMDLSKMQARDAEIVAEVHA
jgi:hypothetical protein